ncbi:MAG TPA: methyltransferase domain-containing protein, partial [Thermomicrobiales bacterium]|nr:methyltransferase domain-containing protein [Thermomicrobiales bacterium]
LPYPDASFDAVWCANTTQYLTDEELATALAELRRVVRPGGLVAVKDADGTLVRVLPAPPGFLLRVFRAAAPVNVPSAGILRAPALPGWLRRAGLVGVWRRTTLIERPAPLAPPSRRQNRDALALLAAHAPGLDLPAADQDLWARLRDPAALEAYLDDPEFCFLEGNILTVGTVPG